MKSLLLVTLLIACGGPAKPPHAADAKPTEFIGWWESETYGLRLTPDFNATLTTKTPCSVQPDPGCAGGTIQGATWDAPTQTLRLEASTALMQRKGDTLVLTLGGTPYVLPRQPTPVELFAKTFADDQGSLEFRADGSCVLGANGIPSPCTWKLTHGDLAIAYGDGGKETWSVWFEPGFTVMHTGSRTLKRP